MIYPCFCLIWWDFDGYHFKTKLFEERNNVWLRVAVQIGFRLLSKGQDSWCKWYWKSTVWKYRNVTNPLVLRVVVLDSRIDWSLICQLYRKLICCQISSLILSKLYLISPFGYPIHVYVLGKQAVKLKQAQTIVQLTMTRQRQAAEALLSKLQAQLILGEHFVAKRPCQQTLKKEVLWRCHRKTHAKM